jgi:parallel beta-helix repeat protein
MRRTYGLLAGTLIMTAGMLPASTVYVATNGNDQWSGRLPQPNAAETDGPLRTLQGTQKYVRAIIRDGLTEPVDVVIRQGAYHLENTLSFTQADSGTPECPVTWRAAEGETVRIRGVRRVTGWKSWQNGIVVADLHEQGFANPRFHQLFAVRSDASLDRHADRLVLARHPNADPRHPRTGGNLTVAETAPKPANQLIYREGDIPWNEWGDIPQAEIVSTYNLGWQFAITPIETVDTETNTITVRRVRGRFLALNRYFVQNVLGALDTPGEWYLDYDGGKLYLMPPESGMDSVHVLAPVVEHLIELAGTIPYPHGYLNTAWRRPREEFPLPENAPPYAPVANIHFRGLHLEAARQDAIRITGAIDCSVTACRIANVGNIGVNLGGITSSFAEVGNPRLKPASGHPLGAGGGGQVLLANDPCIQCRVEGCDVRDTGCEGIMLFGTANTAENNHVYDIGLYAKDAPCINLLGEKNVARRNTLHDCPRCAVFIKGEDNVVELNDCHHANLETCDMGAIRMVQRNAFLKGNIIRHNVVSDSVGYGFRRQGDTFETPYFTWGIYLDDYTCGTTVDGNIVSACARGGIMIHGGGDNTVENNIVVNAGNFMVEFAPIRADMGPVKDVFAGNRTERNILVCTEPDTFPYRFTSQPSVMPTFARNLVWTGGRAPVVILKTWIGIKGWDAWMDRGHETGSRMADPHLKNLGDDRYYPADDSPAWDLGFKPIPLEQIGCYAGSNRASWPIRPNRDRNRETPVIYAKPGAQPRPKTPPPVTLVGPVRETFEQDPVGQPPLRGDVAAPAPASITVTDETAATGKHALRIVDAPGLKAEWLPRIYYPLDFTRGIVRIGLSIKLDPDAPPELYIDPRQYSDTPDREYLSGPMLTVKNDGTLTADGKPLAQLPLGTWVRIELRTPLGEATTGVSTLRVTPATGEAVELTVPHADKRFQRLERIVIASISTGKSIFFMDDIAVEADDE